MNTNEQNSQPNLIKWGLSLAASAGLTGMLCCVAPMVLFMFGLMGGTYAISFANFFYQEDGSTGTGAWVLRGIAVMIGIVGVLMYRKKQQQCSIEPKKQQRNLLLLAFMISVLGVGFFLTFESLSTWYFNEYIDPAKQAELAAKNPQAK